MSFAITSAKITGTPSAFGWTQVHEFIPSDPEKLEKRGHLFAVLATRRKEEGVDTLATGRELLSRLHEEYFGRIEETPFKALKDAVEKVLKEFTQSLGEVEIVTTVVLGDVVYSAAGGGAGVSVYRAGGIGRILESRPEETVAASGYPKPGDFIILGTKAFFENISPGVLKASLEGPDLQSATESLAPVVHAAPVGGNLGVVVIKFDKPQFIGVVAPPLARVNPIKLNKLPNFFKNISAAFGKSLPERKIFVKKETFDEGSVKGRKTTLWVGGILLFLLFVSIGFGIKQNANKKFKAGFQDILTQAREELSQAQNLMVSDPTQARTLFQDSQTKIQELVSRKITDKDVLALDKELKDKETDILGIYRVTPELYLDLSLLTAGFKGDRMVASGDNFYVLDKNGKRVVGIVTATKKTTLLAGPDQVEGISDILAYEDSVYGIFGDGIYLLGTSKAKVIDNTWSGEILAYAYTGNIYVVDKGAGAIWRYSGTDGTFGAKQNWLAASVKPDLTRARQVIIDGTIWFLDDPFDISKFSQGSPQAFIARGVYPDLMAATAIYSNEEEKYLYVLDPAGKRVVVLDKDGHYRAQYLSDQIWNANGIIVSEKDGKIIFLSGDKLYSVEIKHL